MKESVITILHNFGNISVTPSIVFTIQGKTPESFPLDLQLFQNKSIG